MLIIELFFWAFIIYVSYFRLLYILFAGKQHNRFFGTFLNTVFPVVGSFPCFIIASKYEKQVGGPGSKINGKLLDYILCGMHILSIIMLFTAFFRSENASYSGLGLIFSLSSGNEIIPSLVFIYLILFPLISSFAILFLPKNNISTFISYSSSLFNSLSLQAFNFVIASESVEVTAQFWIYSIFNVLIMLFSVYRMCQIRDKFLYKLEYSEKIEYIKDQKKRNEALSSQMPKKNKDDSVYKCAKCGRNVKKGTVCVCISSSKDSSSLQDEVKEKELPSSFCVYCKRALEDGEKCDCQGDGFGITVKNDENNIRKCMYCGQVLVGESTCVCEKILKNSQVAQPDDVIKPPKVKRYFESQIETGKNYVADEIAELEKKINSKFERVIENIENVSVDDEKTYTSENENIN